MSQKLSRSEASLNISFKSFDINASVGFRDINDMIEMVGPVFNIDASVGSLITF
jgi:hypothetical protein